MQEIPGTLNPSTLNPTSTTPATSPPSQAALALQSVGVLKLAVLDDGSRWGAICGEHVSRIQAQITPDQLAGGHSDVLSIYTLGGRLPLVAVGDDGYIMSNITHHCLGAGRADQLRALLTDPLWLEGKLHACGIGAIVFDFRRWVGMCVFASARRARCVVVQQALCGGAVHLTPLIVMFWAHTALCCLCLAPGRDREALSIILSLCVLCAECYFNRETERALISPFRKPQQKWHIASSVLVW